MRCNRARGLPALALKGIAADDGAKAAAIADAGDLLDDFFFALGRAARKDHHAPPVERRLHHVAHALGQSASRHICLRLARLVLLNVSR